MGYFIDNEKNFIAYDVPKGGGTTLRAWIGYHLLGEAQMEGEQDGYYVCSPQFSQKLLHHANYTLDWFNPYDGERVCVKRDPVKRFVSCYRDKVLKEGQYGKASVDQILDNFDRLKEIDHPHGHNTKIGYNWYHFAPQVNHLGFDKDYYTHVFDISEVGTGLREYLNDKWGTDLPDLHARDSTKIKGNTVELTPKQISRVEELYHEDYNAGWF